MKKIRNEKYLCITKDYTISYKRGKIKVRSFSDNQLVNSIKIDSFAKISILNRLLRKEPRCAMIIDNSKCIISNNGKILCYDFAKNTICVEHHYNKRMKNPLMFCKKDENSIYYGEYIWNGNKEPVAVYKRCEKGDWKKIYEFGKDTITHIHNIVWDAKRRVFYILTGDEDRESGIWVADEDFKQVKPILIGKQLYRACVAFPTTNGIVFATDTPLEKNYIVEVTLDGLEVENIEKKYELPGSCIYGTKLKEKMFFATAVEPDSSLPRWRYMITRKLGKGIQDRVSHIISYDESGETKIIASERKDCLPMWLFQFGNFMFPYNETGMLFVCPQALCCGHGNTIILE